MSSGKRRKLDGDEQSQSPVSAVSAIAARRRQAASAARNQGTGPASPAETFTPSANLFDTLQALKPIKEASGSPKKVSRQGNDGRNSGHRPLTADRPKLIPRLEDDKNPDTTSSVSSSSPHVINYSSFRLSKGNHQIKTGGAVELRLDESERFVVLGSFGLKVVEGEVTVAGATLRAGDKISWVHAPHCSALPVIRTIQETRLELHNDKNSSGLRNLSRLSPLLRRIWNESGESVENIVSEQSFQIICSSLDAPKRSVIQEVCSPPEWNQKLASLLPDNAGGNQRTTFICGPKSAGKSTFARLLTNRLLTSSSDGQSPVKQVAVLDLDPGQPEYAPSGTVSLVCVSNPNLGVPFTHAAFDDPSNTIVRCHSLASVSPASNPDLFISCAVDLYETYQRSLRAYPLIINTPGWILGTGLDLLVDLITRIRPAEVIYMSEDGPADVIDVLRDSTKHSFSVLPSQPSEFTSRTAAHLRSMQMMSYYHSQIKRTQKMPSELPRLSWSAAPLTSVKPYIVPYQGNNCGILGILSYDYQSPPELLGASINGSILAIVEIEEPEALRVFVAESESRIEQDAGKALSVCRTAEGLPYIPNPNDSTLDPRYCRTIGLALVRGLDSKRKSLQIITPTPLASFEQIKVEGRAIVLVNGNFDTPHWAYTEDLYARSIYDELPDKELQVTDEETSEDEAEEDTKQVGRSDNDIVSTVPWIEILKGNQRRPVGSRVWRVRRDLGRHNAE